MARFFLGFGLLILAASHSLAQPAQVVILRHAEKPDIGNELSVRGEERAAALVPYFLKTDELLNFKTPVAIFAQKPTNKTPSVRAIETVKPLADALHLTVNDAYVRDDYKRMVQEIMSTKDYEGHMVLICWEHKLIPHIAAEFDAEDAPSSWSGNDFDRTWVITFEPGTTPHCKILPQKLMYGDSDD
jgi:broad specificity phosphatase PhoE